MAGRPLLFQGRRWRWWLLQSPGPGPGPGGEHRIGCIIIWFFSSVYFQMRRWRWWLLQSIGRGGKHNGTHPMPMLVPPCDHSKIAKWGLWNIAQNYIQSQSDCIWNLVQSNVFVAETSIYILTPWPTSRAKPQTAHPQRRISFALFLAEPAWLMWGWEQSSCCLKSSLFTTF